ncbi:nucleoside triphosphatase YtkD, partial [Listeria monocytogenes]|nr:nucleoside triphosphatase YtkD [Listeria monocytogenes]
MPPIRIFFIDIHPLNFSLHTAYHIFEKRKG